MVDEVVIRETRKKLFQSFSPDLALKSHDPRYVDFSEVRGTDGLLDDMVEKIRLSNSPVTMLLSSLSGSGKTTELYRLSEKLSGRLLVSGQPEYLVVQTDAFEAVDLADVDAVDVVLAIVGEIVKKCADHGLKFVPNRFSSFFKDIKELFFSEVNIKELEFDSLIGKVKAEIKTNPGNRTLIRNHLKSRSEGFLEAVNEIISEANERLEALGCGGLVVIFDNLEKIIPIPVPGRGTSHDSLFIDGSYLLRGLKCHKIYTIASSVVLTQGGRLQDLYGEDALRLPMIPVFSRDGQRFEAGISRLIEAVQKRVANAGATMYGDGGTFDLPETVENLCIASGGYLRGLMALFRVALQATKTLPLTGTIIDVAISNQRSSRLLTVDKASVPLLQQINRVSFIEQDERHQRFLENHLVFLYEDRLGPWYDINPVLRTTLLNSGTTGN